MDLNIKSLYSSVPDRLGRSPLLFFLSLSFAGRPAPAGAGGNWPVGNRQLSTANFPAP